MNRRNFLKMGAGAAVMNGSAFFGLQACQPKETSTGETTGMPGQSLLKVKVDSAPYCDWEIRKILPLEDLPGFTARPKQELSRYGGNMEAKFSATGFFRTEKIRGKWWLIDPGGHPYLTVGYNVSKSPKGREEEIVGLLRDTGVTSLGCWSDWETLRQVEQPLPYPVYLGLMRDFMESKGMDAHGRNWKRRYNHLRISIFDPGFEEFCHRQLQETLPPLKNDPYCIGYYSDNELPFLYNALDRYLALPAKDYGHQGARKWLKETKGKSDRSAITYHDRMDFLEYIADTYYSICRNAIKRYDPNHLYLGSRLHGYDISLLTSTTSAPVIRASGKYVDVLSINTYGTIGLSVQELNRWSDWAGKPFHVTEFYAKGMDSGLENSSGAGRVVPTQEDRGRYYQNFTIPLLQSKGCVGWHWHRFIDPKESEDSNKGLVNDQYEPYAPYRKRVKALNSQMYALTGYFENLPEKNSVEKHGKVSKLHRHGFPFFIKGQIGSMDPDRLIDATGNSIRILAGEDFDPEYLAGKYISVMLDVDMSAFAKASAAGDQAKLQLARSKVLQTIDAHKNQEALLVWGLGDQVELTIAAEDRPAYWNQLNELIATVKEKDPNHPVMVTINAGNMNVLPELSEHVPHMDIAGFNAFDFNALRQVPGKLQQYGWTKPFVITEFQLYGETDIRKAPFREPFWIEGERGNVQERTYREVVLNHPQCLGLYMIV